MYWIIDGYNLMRQSATFSELEIRDAAKGKIALLDFLAKFAEVTGEQVRVYFDLYSRVGSSLLEEKHHEIEVVYSRGSYTADEEIILHLREKAPHAFCVSSDKEIQTGAKSSGCSFLTSQEFESWVWKIIDAAQGELDEDEYLEPSLKGRAYHPPKEKKKAWSRLSRLLGN